jgi:hypothetical protein
MAVCRIGQTAIFFAEEEAEKRILRFAQDDNAARYTIV